MSIKLSFSEDGEEAKVVTNKDDRLLCLHNKSCEYLIYKKDSFGINMHCKVSNRSVFEHYYETGECPNKLWWKTQKKDKAWHDDFNDRVCKYDLRNNCERK